MTLSTLRIARDRIGSRLSRWPHHPRFWVFACGALLGVLVLAIGLAVWDLRRVAIAEAVANTDNLAIVLAEQTSQSVQAVDIVLRDVQERIAALNVTTPAEFRTVLRAQDIWRFLRSRLKRVPQVDNLALIDANGAWVNHTVAWPAPVRDVADRDYARHFATQDDPGLFISEPAISRIAGRWSLFLSRRVNGPHGEYLGLVLAMVPLDVFRALYRSINLPGSESLMLLRRDGVVLERYPDPIDRTGTKMPVGSAWYAESGRGGGHYESFGVFDATARLITVRPLRDYPMVMDVGLTEDAILAQWRREAALIAVVTVAAVTCILLMLHRIRLQFLRLEVSRSTLTDRNTDLTRSAEALRSSEADLAATSRELAITLASMRQGLMTVDAAGRVGVCNRRAVEMLDLPGVLMTSRPPLATVPALQWIAAELDLGDTDRQSRQPAAEPRSRERELPNGLIVEVGFVPLAGEDGWVITCQDITARQRAEQQVAFMARHDPLTRLPNRVMFRERIELAIAQTDRAMSAAVLFLDLDHFKAVNDTLGHPVGDRLLCAVADRLDSCVRPVDTIARFGSP